MTHFTEKLRAFLHDPIDKCFDIPSHIERAKNYAEKLGIIGVEEISGPDQIASCMERSLLPRGVKEEFTEIRHPLCEGSLEIPMIDKEDIFNKVYEFYKQIAQEISNWDDKKKFFYLWRNLQDKLFDAFKDEPLGKFISLFPADTRVPDHPIWEHLKVASAINAFFDRKNNLLLQKNSLLLFTIGPVQSFISQARKTQDFYMGSFILSFLTFKAMEVIVNEYGPTNIIYPDLYKQPLADLWIYKNLNFKPVGFNQNSILIPTIPNRFVAILPITEEDKLKDLVNEMKEKIVDTINKAKNEIFSKLEISIEGDIQNKIDSQLSEFPEIYWVAIPWKVGNADVSFDDLKIFFKEDYLKTHENLWNFAKNKGESPPNIGLLYELIYSTLEKSMGARKNVREFRQSVIVDSGRKCSVCGERDLIFFRESVNKEKFLRFNRFAVDLTEKKLVSPKFLADGEGLCAVCFIKRTFEIYLEKEVSQVFKDITFPSTAEIASCDFKERALQKAKEEFINYQKKLKGILSTFQVEPLPKLKRNFENIINIEGALFYDENLRIKYFKDEFGVEVDERTLNELKNLLKDITDKVGKPNSYYAILYLDGDNMGKWLSGELLPEIEFSYNSSVWEKLDEDFKNRLKEALPLNNFFKPRKILTPAVHASISTALRNYALEFVRKIVEEEHLGKLIYAGGDDVLAFVNLKDLLDVMHKLRWAFSGKIKIVNGRIEVDLTNNTGFVEKNGRYLLTMGSQASASVGVVIAHYKTPLQIVIKKVFEMEKEAKSEGRNGFAICLMRRSGEERVAKAKWVYEEKDTVKILKNLINAFDEENQDGYIAKSFIQKVYNNFIRLKENERFIATGEIFNVELSRLLKRSYNLPKGIKVEEEKKKGFLNSVFENMKNLFWDTGESLDNFVNFLIILVFILKAEE